MTQKRTGQVGMLVLVIVQAVLILGFGAATAFLALRDRKAEAELASINKEIKPFVDVRGGKVDRPDASTSPARAALIKTLEKSYEDALSAKQPASTVLVELVVNSEKLATRLLGKADTIDADEVQAQLPRLYFAYMRDLKLVLTSPDGKIIRQEVVQSPQQLVHLNVADALGHMRANIALLSEEVKTEKGKFQALSGFEEWKKATEGVTVAIEGREATLFEHVSAKHGGEGALTPSKYIDTLATFVAEFAKTAKAAEARAVEAEKARDEAVTAFRGKQDEFKDTNEKQLKEFGEKQTAVSTELDKTKASLEDKIKNLNDEVNRYKQVFKDRLQMAPDMLTADLMLEASGTIASINERRKTVVLDLKGRIRNRILPGYKFSVYTADPSVPMNRESLKGKVEVVSVNGGFAEARILEGIKDNVITLNERDRIANPFVGRQVRHVALVGYFDLNGDGEATEDETKQLIDYINYKWGGRVDTHSLYLDKENNPFNGFKETTDFIVVGYIPNLRPDEAADSGSLTDAQRIRVTRIKRMDDQLKEARDVSSRWLMPVLNQNRFLDILGVARQTDNPFKKY